MPTPEQVRQAIGDIDPEPAQAYCAHISGIEHVKVTQSQGSVYEWWRCMICRTEFRPTGEPSHGEASNRDDRP